MNDAAVGFHCPDCIAEGRRTTRQARTAYGGLHPASFGYVSKVLIGINVAVWLLIATTGGDTSRWFSRLALIPYGECGDGRGGYFPTVTSQHECSLVGPAHGAHWIAGVATGAPWQLLTSMFTHETEPIHIAFNMLALWFLGPQLEAVLGRLRFTLLYLLSGLLGSAAVYLFSAPATPTLGASGAIFGLMAALLVIALKAGADVSQLLVWIGINAAITVFAPNISWEGHVGGFVGGAVIALALTRAPRERRVVWQAAGYGAVAVAIVVIVLLRTAALT
jgi:membrane associated rhomboid family serine protease